MLPTSRLGQLVKSTTNCMHPIMNPPAKQIYSILAFDMQKGWQSRGPPTFLIFSSLSLSEPGFFNGTIDFFKGVFIS